MVHFSREILANGLRVLVHEDRTTPLVAINVLYDVGSRDEQPDKTGFAHLFEHLMFAGSKHIKDFDDPLQRAGGENNAYTTNDYTTFYEILPKENLETALWLESDRMLALNIGKRPAWLVLLFRDCLFDYLPRNFHWHFFPCLSESKLFEARDKTLDNFLSYSTRSIYRGCNSNSVNTTSWRLGTPGIPCNDILNGDRMRCAPCKFKWTHYRSRATQELYARRATGPNSRI